MSLFLNSLAFSIILSAGSILLQNEFMVNSYGEVKFAKSYAFISKNMARMVTGHNHFMYTDTVRSVLSASSGKAVINFCFQILPFRPGLSLCESI